MDPALVAGCMKFSFDLHRIFFDLCMKGFSFGMVGRGVVLCVERIFVGLFKL